jgi:hypothetical protein
MLEQAAKIAGNVFDGPTKAKLPCICHLGLGGSRLGFTVYTNVGVLSPPAGGEISLSCYVSRYDDVTGEIIQTASCDDIGTFWELVK